MGIMILRGGRSGCMLIGSSLFGIPAKYLLFFLGASTHVAVRPLLIHRKHGLLASHDTCNLEQFTHATFVFFSFFSSFFEYGLYLQMYLGQLMFCNRFHLECTSR